jgi:hypothetical protein
MSGADAGLPGILAPEQIAALSAVKVKPRPAAKPARPAPEPADDARPLAELDADREAAAQRLGTVREQRLALAGKLEAIDRAIEQTRAESLDVTATRSLRAERDTLTAELAELGELEGRATAAHDRLAVASARTRTRLDAERLRAELSALIATGPDSDAEGIAAVSALLDWEERRFALIEQANRLKAEMLDIPADLRGAVPNTNPLQLTVDPRMRSRR